MIDLHCHILPALDDGALDLPDSIGMALQARADRIATVCATPHIRHDHDVAIERLPGLVAALNGELERREIAVRIVPGGEVAETALARLSDEHLRAVTLGAAGGWILLEPAPGPLGDTLHDAVDQLAARGLRVVLAHPERHAGAGFEQRLEAFAAQGCLIQWTAAFVAEEPSDIVLRLAARGLVHLLASDAHSSHGGRPVALRAGYARLAGVLDDATIAWMAHEAPTAILRGEPVTPPAARS